MPGPCGASKSPAAGQRRGLLVELHRAVYLYRRRCADGEPIVRVETYLPYDLCSFTLTHDFTTPAAHQSPLPLGRGAASLWSSTRNWLWSPR